MSDQTIIDAAWQSLTPQEQSEIPSKLLDHVPAYVPMSPVHKFIREIVRLAWDESDETAETMKRTMTLAEAFEELKKIVGPGKYVGMREHHTRFDGGKIEVEFMPFFYTEKGMTSGIFKSLPEAIAFVRNYKPAEPTPAERFAALTPEQQTHALAAVEAAANPPRADNRLFSAPVTDNSDGLDAKLAADKTIDGLARDLAAMSERFDTSAH